MGMRCVEYTIVYRTGMASCSLGGTSVTETLCFGDGLLPIVDSGGRYSVNIPMDHGNVQLPLGTGSHDGIAALVTKHQGKAVQYAAFTPVAVGFSCRLES